MFKGLGNFGAIFRQAQEMGGRLEAMKQRLRLQHAKGASGGGMVQVEVNGAGEVLSVSIEPALFDRGQREMVEDLVPAAVNQALAKAREMYADEMKSLTADLGIPGLDQAIAKLMDGNLGGE